MSNIDLVVCDIRAKISAQHMVLFTKIKRSPFKNYQSSLSDIDCGKMWH